MYSISLFLHIVGALGLFASLAIEQAALVNLRRAASTEQAREWLSLMRALQRIQGPSALLLLVTGLYMMITSWRGQAWAASGLVGMVLMAIIGMVVSGRRMKGVGLAMPAAEGPLPLTVRDRLADPALRMSAFVRVGLALGIVFNMSVKPSTSGAVAALVVATVLGITWERLTRASTRSIRGPAMQE